MMTDNKKIYAWEPWFFMAFGIFHLHRIWALIDRQGYADFWLGALEKKGVFYFTLSGVLSALCILGIVTFIRSRGKNYWWRYVYLFGGAYLLFDLFAIAADLSFWNKLLMNMFDITSKYWVPVWTFFILLGGFVFVLGISLLRKRKG